MEYKINEEGLTADDIMVCNHIEWTDFTVEQHDKYKGA